MTHDFNDQDFLIANYQLSLDNNSMLRLILHNQALIMQKLQIPIGINSALMATLLPKEYKSPNPNPGVAEMMELPSKLGQLIEYQLAEHVFDYKRIKKEIEKNPNLGIQVEEKG